MRTMIFADDVTDDTGGLLVGLVVVVTQFLHRVEHATVHRLEAVAGIGKRAPHDHAHGVIEVGPPHLVFEIDGENLLRKLTHSGTSQSGRPPGSAAAFLGGFISPKV
jgi:hypothetical protein